MATTTLAKQLKKLKVPGQFSSIDKQNSKPSLLFTASEAAKIDLDTIHAMGLNGLEELSSMDPSLIQFTESLFSEASKHFERSVESRESIEELDKTISAFLRLLSPYFLLRPAHKCMEWLIRAFLIHQCNIDSLMECILPYYHTNLFARVVQLLHINDPASLWYWLLPIKKEGTPLSHLTLVKHCISDLTFFVFVCRMVPLSLSVHSNTNGSSLRVLLSFYCSTVCQVLERGVVSEDIVSRLLPFLLKGFKSSNLDYRASSYMITSLLCSRVKLEVRVTSSLMESITKYYGPSLKEEALPCLIVLAANSTESTNKLTNRTLKHFLSKSDQFLPMMEVLSHQCDISGLLNPLLCSLVDRYMECIDESYGLVILGVLNEIELRTPSATALTGNLIDGYLENHKRLNSETPCLVQLAKALDNKYPAVFEQVLHSTMNRITSEGRKGLLKALQRFITFALPGTRHQLSPVGGAGSSTLALSLYHPDSSIRASAVQHLKSLVDGWGSGDSAHSDDYNREFMTRAITARIIDDDPEVIAAVLQIDHTVLTGICKEELMNCLNNLLSRKKLTSGSKEWQSCLYSCVSLLSCEAVCGLFPTEDIVIHLLRLLFLSYHSNDQFLHILQLIEGSYVSSSHPLLANISSLAQECVQLSSSSSSNLCVEKLLNHFAKQLVSMATEDFDQMLQKLLSSLNDSDQFLHFFIIPLLGLSMESHHSYHLLLAVPLSNYLSSQSTLLAVNGEMSLTHTPTLSAILEQLLMHKRTRGAVRTCHTHLLLWLINQLIDYTISPTALPSSLWLSPPVQEEGSVSDDHQYYWTVLRLFILLTEFSDSNETTPTTDQFRPLLQKLFKVHFSGRGALLRFLAMIWTVPVSTTATTTAPAAVTERIQVCALKIAEAYIRSVDHGTAVALLSNYCPVVSSLLLPLASPNQSLRIGSFHCLQCLHKAAIHSDPTVLAEIYPSCPLLHLLDYLMNCRVQLIADPLGLQLELQKLFNQDQSLGDSVFPRHVPATPSTKRGRRSQKKAESKGREEILQSILQSLLLMVTGLDTPPNYICQQLLSILEGVNHKCKLLGLLSSMKLLINKVKDYNCTTEGLYPLTDSEAAILQSMIACYTPSVATWIDTEPEVMDLFLTLLTFSVSLSPTVPSLAVQALNQVTDEFYTSLSNSQWQNTLIESIFDLMIVSNSSAITVLAKECLQQLPLTAQSLIHQLLLQESKLRPVKVQSHKKRKSRATAEVSSIDGKSNTLLPWKRVTAVLELMQSSSSTLGEDCHQLIASLFSLLSWSFDTREISKEESLEYTQQLILASLLNICTLLYQRGKETAQVLLPEDQFNVEQVIQCLRHSVNTHTQHTALLLLATAANIYPARILHNLMPVFTFMGSNMLCHDDSYTFSVINRTVESIIPTLMKSSSNKQLIISAAEIYRVFIDAIPHVPAHRQLPLLSHLVQVMGPLDYLYLPLGLLTEKAAVLHGAGGEGAVSNVLLSSPKELIHLAVSLAHQFTVQDQLIAIIKLLQYCRLLPPDKPSGKDSSVLSKSITLIFNVRLYSSEQLRRFRLTLLTVMGGPLLSRIQRDTSCCNHQELIMNILQECFYYIGSLNKCKGAATDVSTDIKYWDSLISKVNEIIDRVIFLTSNTDFLSVLVQLLADRGTQDKAMALLRKKLETCSDWSIDEEQQALLMECVSVIMNNLTGGDTIPSVAQQTTSLHCLKCIISRIGSSNCDQFISITQSLISLIEENKFTNPLVLSNALYCIAESCTVLTVHLIPLLPLLVPSLLNYIDDSSPILQLSAVTALRVVVETLPKFISSFVNVIVTKMCRNEFVQQQDRDSSDNEKVVTEASILRGLLSSNVPSRVLLPALYESVTIVMDYGKESVIALVLILRACIDGQKRRDINQTLLVDTLQSLLEYRSSHTNDKECDITAVEEEINHCFCELVLKLSETSFRPILRKLLQWSTVADISNRTLTFYHLIKSIAGKLKVLFLLFVEQQLMDSIVTVLSSCHISKTSSIPFSDSAHFTGLQKTSLCIQLILDTLYSCFLYDRGGSFLTKDRFNFLLNPLIDQVTNTQVGGASYQDMIRTHLMPCIAQMTVAAGKERYWKQINQLLLLKTRDDDPQVRLSSLLIVQAVYLKLGEAFSVLLPETIPFLSELMEDESQQVEQQVQSTLQTITSLTGEPVEQYFV